MHADPETSAVNYDEFLKSRCARQWRRIGVQRRAGVNVPLFSLYSQKSIGVGEFGDLTLLADWCVRTGMSLIQLLPMNDVGYDFRPYDGQSTFALDPMHLSLENIAGISPASFAAKMEALRSRFPCKPPRVNYAVKKEKLLLLREMFQGVSKKLPAVFRTFCREQDYWLRDYALFRVLKEKNQGSWESWPEDWKHRDPQTMEQILREEAIEIEFQKWIQWQCFEQFRAARAAALKKGVYFMGDLPFLVSRDSAEVWTWQQYFKLDRVSGAPPDAYIAEGQRWGMPPYRWELIEKDGYRYLISKLQYAQHFYDLFRIDHVVGLFRLWTIAQDEPAENAGRYGAFDPQNENFWEEHGRKIIAVMAAHTEMLPCAEDLGVVPPCSYKVLEEFAIPGMEVQRWARHWSSGGRFRNPSEYRKCAISLISTHDMPIFLAWWLFEAGTVDGGFFDNLCRSFGIDPSVRERVLEPVGMGRFRWRPGIRGPHDLAAALGRAPQDLHAFTQLFQTSRHEKEQFVEFAGAPGSSREGDALIGKALLRAAESRAVFNIQLLQDWLSLGGFFREDPWNARINFPGSVSPSNWSVVSPLSLEAMLEQAVNGEILAINRNSGRI